MLKKIGLEPPVDESTPALAASGGAEEDTPTNHSVHIWRIYSRSAKRFMALGRRDDPRWAAVFKRAPYDADIVEVIATDQCKPVD